MIDIPTSVKNEYKDYNREIEIYGNLYIASKRPSKNLFNVYDITGDTITNKNDGSLEVSAYANATNQTLKEICPDLQIGQPYTLSLTSTSTRKYIYIVSSQYVWQSGTSYSLTQAELDSTFAVYGNTSGTYTIKDIIINAGETAETYEEYGDMITEYELFPLTEENNAKILSLSIDLELGIK